MHQYYPGSYHPVDIGDFLCGGSYKVLRKLGYSSRSTVWVVRQIGTKFHYAVKIQRAEESVEDDIEELMMYMHLEKTLSSEVIDRHFTNIVDAFEEKGPNGIHKCIVYEAMGADANLLLESFRGYIPGKMTYSDRRFSVRAAKQIMRDTLEAFQVLHDNGIAYNSFHHGNILFALKKSLDDETGGALWHPANVWDDIPDSISKRIEREDGKSDPYVPKHVHIPKQLVNFVDTGPNLHVKMGDLDGSYFFDKPPPGQRTPFALRAPELIFADNIPDATKDGRQLDVWGLGCLLFETVTGRPLFVFYYHIDTDRENDDHMLALILTLGPAPPALHDLWPRSDLYFCEAATGSGREGERTLYCANLGGMNEVGSDEEPFVPDPYPMEKLFDDAAPKLAKTDEGTQIKKLIREILQYDPAKRPTVAQILQDLWFVRNDWGSERVDDPGYEDDDRKESDDKKMEMEKDKEKDDDSSRLGDSDNSEHAEEDAAYDYDVEEYDEDDVEIILNKSRKGKGKDIA